jgi:hypothetical protein
MEQRLQPARRTRIEAITTCEAATHAHLGSVRRARGSVCLWRARCPGTLAHAGFTNSATPVSDRSHSRLAPITRGVPTLEETWHDLKTPERSGVAASPAAESTGSNGFVSCARKTRFPDSQSAVASSAGVAFALCFPVFSPRRFAASSSHRFHKVPPLGTRNAFFRERSRSSPLL